MNLLAEKPDAAAPASARTLRPPVTLPIPHAR